MRVLHVAEVTHGGVITLVDAYARYQVTQGYDVHVLAPRELADLPGTRHAWSPDRHRPLSLCVAERRLRAVVREVEPDVVHLHSFFAGVLGRGRPLPGPAAVVYQPHSFAFDAASRTVAAMLERWAARHTDRMVTNCLDELDEGRSHGVQVPATVVGLPVDTDRFAPGSVDPAVLRASLGLHAEFVAVCVGRLSRQKGQRRLAEAWDADPPAGAQLVFVGPGDPADIAEVAPRSFGSGVVVAGAHSDVRPWLWAASVGVQPSLYEGQSVAMAEALACGLPLVMTDVNGAREAIMPPGEDPAGAVVDVSDLEGLMRELNRRRGNRDLLAAESKTARDRALRLFAADQAMARIERAYVDALSARSRRSRARKRRAGWWT